MSHKDGPQSQTCSSLLSFTHENNRNRISIFLRFYLHYYSCTDEMTLVKTGSPTQLILCKRESHIFQKLTSSVEVGVRRNVGKWLLSLLAFRKFHGRVLLRWRLGEIRCSLLWQISLITLIRYKPHWDSIWVSLYPCEPWVHNEYVVNGTFKINC